MSRRRREVIQVAIDTIARDRSEGPARVTFLAAQRHVGPRDRERGVVKGRTGPGVVRVAVVASAWKTVCRMARRQILVRLVTVDARTRDRLVHTARMTRHAIHRGVRSGQREETVIESRNGPRLGRVTGHTILREVAGRVTRRSHVVRLVAVDAIAR